MPTLAVRNLAVGYDRRPVVSGLTGTFAPGTLTAVIGPNGSGKSTLLKTLAGILPPLSGAVERAGPRRDIAFLPQRAEIDRSFPADVADLVALGLWRRRGAWGGIKTNDREAMAAALRTVGIADLARQPIDTLSGGQLQRTLFARVLLEDAPVILLDEPFAAVDEQAVADLVPLLQCWAGEGRTVVAVLHDMALVRRVFPRTLLLGGKTALWGSTAEVLRPETLRAVQPVVDPFAAWASDTAGAA